MKKILILFCCILLTNQLLAQAPLFHWVKKTFEYRDGYNWGVHKLELDDSDNIYVIGVFDSTRDFDPGPAVYNLTADGLSDMFVQKLDKDGNFVWARSFASRDEQSPIDLCLDKKGQIYITGSFLGPVDFDPGLGTYFLTSYGSNAVFVLKLDNNGNFIWAKSMGGLGNDYGTSIAVDSTGNVLTTGNFSMNDADFDPGPAVYNLSCVGSSNTFISKLDSNGKFVWAKSFTTSPLYSLEACSIKIDKLGNIYAFGDFSGVVDFDPGTSIARPDSLNGTYLVKLTPAGSFVWFKEFAGINTNTMGLMMDKNENFIISAWMYNNTVDADPGAGTYTVSKPAIKGASIIIKLNVNGHFVWSKIIEGAYYSSYFLRVCGSDVHNSLYFSGYFRDSIDVDPSTVYHPLRAASYYDSYLLRLDSNGLFSWVTQFDDSIYNANAALSKSGNIYCNGVFRKKADFDPGIDTFYLTCDSIKYTSYILKISRCQNKTDLVATACNKLNIAGKTYTTSGKYTPYFKGTSGCDSIINLDLTVNYIDTAVSKTAFMLTAIASGVSYQWVKCPSFTKEIGATSKTFTPLLPGSYAVIVSNSICSDTSACYSVFGTNIENVASNTFCIITPNPSKGSFEINISQQLLGAQLSIHNLLGQKISESLLRQENNTQTLKPGFYIITLTKEQNRIVKKLLVE